MASYLHKHAITNTVPVLKCSMGMSLVSHALAAYKVFVFPTHVHPKPGK